LRKGGSKHYEAPRPCLPTGRHRARLPGNELSFVIVPLDSAYKAGLAGHRAGQTQHQTFLSNILVLLFEKIMADLPIRIPSPYSSISFIFPI